MEKFQTYRDHTIVVNTDRQMNAGWCTTYTVRGLACQNVHSDDERVPGTFASEENAVAAGLQAAKQHIDHVHPA